MKKDEVNPSEGDGNPLHPSVAKGLASREQRKNLENENAIRTVQIIKAEATLLSVEDTGRIRHAFAFAFAILSAVFIFH